MDAPDRFADESLGRKVINTEGRIHKIELHRLWLYQQVDSLSDEDQQALIVLLASLVKRSKVRSVMGEVGMAKRRTERS